MHHIRKKIFDEDNNQSFAAMVETIKDFREDNDEYDENMPKIMRKIMRDYNSQLLQYPSKISLFPQAWYFEVKSMKEDITNLFQDKHHHYRIINKLRKLLFSRYFKLNLSKMLDMLKDLRKEDG